MTTAILFGGPKEKLPSISDTYVPLETMSFLERDQVFGMWLGIVYFNRTPPPPPLPPDVHTNLASSVQADFEREYEAGAWRQLDRGLTLEEIWYINESGLGPSVCVVNEDAPEQPMERIRRLVRTSPEKMLEVALEHFQLNGPVPALVYDGEFGHGVVLAGADEAAQRITFHDPWPGRSLLCAENNAAGVKAEPAGRFWQLTRRELMKVLYSFTITEYAWSHLESAASLAVARRN